MLTAVFESFDGSRSRWNGWFENPRSVHIAHTTEQVLPVIQTAEEETRKGRYAVVMLAYEAAPAFDPVLSVHATAEFPLAWAAIFDEINTTPPHRDSGAYQAPEWKPLISRETYEDAIHRIREYIASGDTYQVNYTFPLACKFAGDSWTWFRELGAAQGAGYCAYLDPGRYKVLSLSPELFFERRGDRLITRPMKGTMPRGRWTEEDDEQAKKLAASPKDRAENVMIVDLLRNDLGKISVTGSVQTTKLFEVERYRNVLQMTSTVESVCKPGIGLSDMLRALFPCGSITGAPKVRTMQIIRELEPFPRHAYTGAIGLVHPGGDCIFNVAIRTLIVDRRTGEASFGVGGGITYDSTPEGEYDECLLKANFLNRRWPEFQLLETMLLEGGDYFLLERHIRRIKASARYFNYPWDEEQARSVLDQIRLAHVIGKWKVRLLVGRNGAITGEAREIKPAPEKVWRVTFAPASINLYDPFIYHKTTNRVVYEQALQKRPGYDDVIFWNERGEVTESSIANLVLEVGGKRITPPQHSGLLRGAFRDELLASGELQERVIYKDDLLRSQSFFLINSVRKWVKAVLV